MDEGHCGLPTEELIPLAATLRSTASRSILGSGMIPGIGPVYARKLVKAVGATVFDVIEAEPDRLREVTGIGPMRARRITDAWAEQKHRRHRS